MIVRCFAATVTRRARAAAAVVVVVLPAVAAVSSACLGPQIFTGYGRKLVPGRPRQDARASDLVPCAGKLSGAWFPFDPPYMQSVFPDGLNREGSLHKSGCPLCCAGIDTGTRARYTGPYSNAKRSEDAS